MKAINVKFGKEADRIEGRASPLSLQLGMALHNVNGKASTHTFTGLDQINELVESAEYRLEKLGIAKKYRPGAKFIATSGDAVPKSYKWARDGTQVMFERRSNGWCLVDISATKISIKGGESCLALTQGQDAMVVATLRKKYRVQATE